jgi:two-component system, OmpR family, sensor histidine kinase CpxA
MMRSLFLKIFLWFWVTVIATGVAFVVTFILQPGGVPAQWHAGMSATARMYGDIAVEEADRGGASTAQAYLSNIRRQAKLHACLYGQDGSLFAGEGCSTFAALVERAHGAPDPQFDMRYGLVRIALRLKGRDRSYIFATDLPAGPRAAFGENMHVILLHWLIAFLVSGGICYLLARYITGPILRLSAASRQLADGNLKARAGARMEKRRDEIGGLVKDFNRMAERTEELINSQRQLITDVSHELRSPLARLNVALDLARERKGNDPAFAQMGQDIERLGEMVGRILTVARLDSTSILPEMALLNFSRLLSEVAADADFEARRRNCTVQFSGECDCDITGSSDLLRSALDNVVRNAVRYTAAGTQVEVHLRCVEVGGVRSALVSVRDRGPGVPEKELSRIFHPFYRLAEARDRQSGGAGLGLAIASRIVELHGGTIHASNASGGGLQVDISIPLTR